ncbi:hypothetical protein L6R52_44180 [Myxococcota bacterium]|nr:hypothetical protein [Myxococcota bacterium]
MAVLTSLGCVRTEELVLPPLPDGGAGIIAHVVDGDVEALIGVDLELGGGGAAAFLVTPTSRFYAFLYPCARASVGFERGPLPTTYVPPKTDLVYAFDPAVPGAQWVRTDERPRGLEYVEPSRCTRFVSAALFALPGTEVGPPPQFAVALDDERVLVGGTSYGPISGTQEVFWVASREGFEQVILSGKPGTHAGWLAPDGRLFLLRGGGGISEGRLGGTFTVTSSLSWVAPRDLYAARMTGRVRDGEVELFVVTERGTFEWFDGAEWHLLHRSEGCGEIDCGHGAVVALPSGDVLAAIPGAEPYVHRFVDGRLEREAFTNLEGPFLRRVKHLTHVPGWGTILGTILGELYLKRGDTLDPDEPWEQLERPGLNGVVGLGTFERSAVWVSEGALLERPVDSSERCSDTAYGIGKNVGGLLQVGSDLFVFTWQDLSETYLHFLAVEPPPPSACAE